MRLALLAFAAALAATPAAAQKTTLNVVTAGDQNMVDYVKDFLAPRFEKTNPKAPKSCRRRRTTRRGTSTSR